MRIHTLAVFTLVALTLGAVPARAQDAPTVAVTPFAATGTAGSSPIGAAVTFPMTSALGLETEVAYRRGEGDIHAPSTNASLLFSLPRVGLFTPYGAAGVGLAKYGEPFTFHQLGGSPQLGTASRLAATVNFGGGIKTQITERMDFRTDVRWFQSPTRQPADQFRLAFGVGFNVGQR